MTKSCLF